MDLVYNYSYYLYNYWDEIQDNRTKSYPLVAVHPITMSAIMYSYYLIVTKIGPTMLKNHAPFQLRRLMFSYNMVMVTVNGFFLYEAIRRSDYFRFLGQFEYPDRNDSSPETMEVSE